MNHHCQLKEPSQLLPLPSEGSVEDEELPAQRDERDLVQKLKVLRHELSLQQPQAGHCHVEISREEIFEYHLPCAAGSLLSASGTPHLFGFPPTLCSPLLNFLLKFLLLYPSSAEWFLQGLIPGHPLFSPSTLRESLTFVLGSDTHLPLTSHLFYPVLPIYLPSMFKFKGAKMEFFHWEIFDYWFNLFTSNWSIQIFCFFLTQSW